MSFTWQRFSDYYLRRCFGLTGVVDMLVFVISIIIVFYTVKKFKGSAPLWKVIWMNVMWAVIYAAGMYGAWLLIGGFFFCLTDIDLIINYVTKLIIMLAFVIFFCKESGRARTISAATFFALNIVIIEVGGSLTGVLNAASASTVEEYIRAAITCLTLVVAVLIRVWNIAKYKDIPLVAVFAVVLYSAIGFVVAILRSQFMQYFNVFEGTEYYEYSYYIQLFAAITLGVIVLYNMVCYFLIYNIIGVYERNEILYRSLVQKEGKEALEALSEDNLKQMRAIRHDLKNRFAIMQSMLDNEQYAELKKYFAEMNKEAIVPLSQVNSGNQTLDVVLNLEISKAVAYGIKIDSKIVVPPSLPMTDLDLDRLISNLLDNAIEACQKIPEEQRSITLSINTVHDYLVIDVSNTMRPDKIATALSLETDKPDKNMHGQGSKIIDTVAAKYKGYVNRDIVDGRFTVSVMLEMDSSQFIRQMYCRT